MVLTPKLDAVTLDDLTDSDGDRLATRGSFDGERYASVDLADRNLTDVSFSECEFSGVTLTDAVLRGARFQECTFELLNASVLAAPHSTWRDVEIRQSRIGAAELFDAELSGVLIEHSKLGFVNLRGAELHDVLLTDCQIEELDLGQATATRLTVRDCTIGTLDTTSATLKDVDLRASEFSVLNGIAGLRGATIDDNQLASLAPLLASAAGLSVE